MKRDDQNSAIDGVAHKNPTPEPDLDRKIRFAQRAGVSPRCLDNWIRDRRIPFLRVGKIVLIPWKEALGHLNHNYRVSPRGTEMGQL
jgi:hypothetical protein